MRIGIVGAGGVGGYFGARLAAAGYDVSWLARGQHLAAMLRDGLQIRSQLGDLHLPHVQASAAAASIGAVDVLLITVKLWDLADAIQAAKPMIGPQTTVIALQNGVQKDALVREGLGDVAMLGGVAYIEAHIESPGVIQHGGTLQRLVFGAFDGADSPVAEQLLAACQASGIVAEISPHIEQSIWEKFVFLVGMSAITSATRLPLGPIRANPRSRALLLELMREVTAVARASGIALPADFADSQITRLDNVPATMTSSMAKDLARGNRLEVAWLSGHVAELGEQFGVPTPANRIISDVLAPHAAGRRD